ncbi:hypothetical protein H4R34_000790 [Dimargaris verticillata]|uniref:NF-kappa-B-activating protein C-terminal domain-containing protein n=1 Tax=Dimargaris verticillata TaxID=2761393 RepID=A0A9W8B7F6_9FUNG|nr:hypothetical protein H4R34_000790 [Dimargaris verticillata]
MPRDRSDSRRPRSREQRPYRPRSPERTRRSYYSRSRSQERRRSSRNRRPFPSTRRQRSRSPPPHRHGPPTRPMAPGGRFQPMGPEYLAHRREQREALAYSIWPPSPPGPQPDTPPSSPSDQSVSDAATHRRHRKGKRSSTRRSHRSSRRRHRGSPSPSDSATCSDSDTGRHRSRPRSKSSRHRSQALSSAAAQPAAPDQLPRPDSDQWAEKKVEPGGAVDVGPTPLPMRDTKLDERSYGGALLAGEGSAMAAYVQEGKRIPRRGEIGLNSEEIQHYESSGYVMSGSRHHRMNAVRIRKENQVINAEEKRALLLLSQEEKAKKETKIISNFRELLHDRLKGKLD